jgi:hypothetical protein
MRKKFLVAVHMLFMKDGKVFLLRLFNKGIKDGEYSESGWDAR